MSFVIYFSLFSLFIATVLTLCLSLSDCCLFIYLPIDLFNFTFFFLFQIMFSDETVLIRPTYALMGTDCLGQHNSASLMTVGGMMSIQSIAKVTIAPITL